MVEISRTGQRFEQETRDHEAESLDKNTRVHPRFFAKLNKILLQICSLVKQRTYGSEHARQAFLRHFALKFRNTYLVVCLSVCLFQLRLG